MKIPAFALVNGGHMFEDASQKTEAIYIERTLSLTPNCCWFLFPSIDQFLFKFCYAKNGFFDIFICYLHVFTTQVYNVVTQRK